VEKTDNDANGIKTTNQTTLCQKYFKHFVNTIQTSRLRVPGMKISTQLNSMTPPSRQLLSFTRKNIKTKMSFFLSPESGSKRKHRNRSDVSSVKNSRDNV